MNGPIPAAGDAMPRRSTAEYAEAWGRCRRLGKELSKALADTGDYEYGMILPAGRDFAVSFGKFEGDEGAARPTEYPMQTINRLGQRIGLTLADDPLMPAERVTIDRSGVYIQTKTLGMPDLPVVDPLMEAINAYRAGVARLKAVPADQVTAQSEDELVRETYQEPMDRLLDWSEPALTREGAIAALTFMGDHNVFCDGMGEPLRLAVLGYLETL